MDVDPAKELRRKWGGAGREILFIHEKTDCRGDLYPRKIIQTLPRAISFSVHPRRRTAGLNRFSSARRKRLGHTGGE